MDRFKAKCRLRPCRNISQPPTTMPRILILTLALLLPLAAGEIRTWTNPDGSKTFKAEFIRRDKDTVTLRPIGGKELSMGMDKLHADDQGWLKENHPTEAETKAAEVPDEAAIFDTLKFGDTRDAVTAKLKASKMVETNLNSTFFGRTGINGIYRTVQPIGGLHCYLFFDWDEAGLLKEISLRTEDKVAGEYEAVLKPCWQALTELIVPIYGKPLQTTKMPAASDLTSEQMLASHLWRIEQGGTVMLGASRLGEAYQVSVLFTNEKIEPRPTP
jgi:hypothetical protein